MAIKQDKIKPWKRDNNDGVTLSFFGPRAIAPKRTSESLDNLIDDLDDESIDNINSDVVNLFNEAINDGVN